MGHVDIQQDLQSIANPSRSYNKGSIIYFQGEAPRQAFLIREGIVRVYAIDDEGEEYIVGFYGEGELFPLDWLYGKNSSTSFYYEALTPTELLPIEKVAFQKIIKEPAVNTYIVNQFLQESTTGLIRNLASQQARAHDKIIYLFYFLAIRHGKELSNGLFSLGIPLTHQTIADCLGLTRETVATELGGLKRSGAVAYRNKKYIVDKKLIIKAVGKEINNIG